MKYHHLAAVLIIALCALSAQAQSGRRRTAPPPVAPVPTPTPEPTPTPKKTDKEDELLFFMGAERHFTYMTLPYSFYDAVLRGCADRLQKGSSAIVDLTDKDLTRGEAIKRAKSETKSFVVLLTLEFDQGARSYDDLILEYIVLAPVTAKIITGGRSYMTGRRAGRIVVQPPTQGQGIYREEMLRRMGEDAGERILKAMHLNVPVRPK